MRKNEKSRNMDKKRRKFRFGIITFLFSIIATILSILFVIQILAMGILPLHLSVPLSLIAITICLIIFVIANFIKKRGIIHFFCGFLALVLCVVFAVGNNYIYRTNTMLESVTNLTNKMTNTVSIITMNGSGIENLSDLNGLTVSSAESMDKDATNRCISDLNSEGVSVNLVDYENYQAALAALYNNEVNAMVLNEAYRGLLHENEEFTGFGNITTIIHKTVYYTERENTIEISKDAVNVVSEPFTILISGNDSYGSLNETSRSDVNMLVTVNPSTHKILLTSIPRDYYLKMACSASSTDCPEGSYDKLTHSGLYGVDSTEKTIEEAFGIDINYYVRVNFSSLVNLVDALGGIDVEVEPGLEVDTFYANGTEGVHAGTNHLDGERALAFARERYAYADGDVQRNKNQQQVLMRMFEKIASPSMIVNFGNFVDALGGAFETNMSSEDMLSLIRYEFTFFPDWTFEQCGVEGYQDTMYSTVLGDYSAVTIGNTQSMDIAKQKIQAVINGESADSITTVVDENVYTPYLDDSVASDTPTYTEDPNQYYDVPVTEDYYDSSYDTQIDSYEDPYAGTYDTTNGNEDIYYDQSSEYQSW